MTSVDDYTLQRVYEWRKAGRSWSAISENLGKPVDRLRMMFQAPFPVISAPKPWSPTRFKEWSFWDHYRVVDDAQTLPDILAKVVEMYGFSADLIRSGSHSRAIAWPRQHFMFLAIEGGYSTPRIGKFLGRDHSTVIYGARTYKARVGK